MFAIYFMAITMISVCRQMDGGEDAVINVTIPLQHQVKDSSLRIPSEVSKVQEVTTSQWP